MKYPLPLTDNRSAWCSTDYRMLREISVVNIKVFCVLTSCKILTKLKAYSFPSGSCPHSPAYAAYYVRLFVRTTERVYKIDVRTEADRVKTK